MSDSSTKTAVITAVLTGVFTVLAGIATYWFTTKEPAISYSVIAGPTVAGTGGTKRIYVVEVRNSGSKEVAQTLVQLVLKTGELTEVAAEATPGVKLTEEKTARQIDIRADMLNPGDTVKLSLLMSLVPPETEPKVTVRAPGVQAVADSSKKDESPSLSNPSGLLVLFAPALAAVMSSFLLLSRSALGRKLGLKSIGSEIDKYELVAYICEACGLAEEAEHLRFGGSNVSYRGAADYLRYRAMRASDREKEKYDVALRSFLLIDSIAASSVDSIRWSIDSIAQTGITDGEFTTLRKQAIDEGSQPMRWRELVDAFVGERLAHAKA